MDKNEDGSSFSPQKGIFSDNNQEDQIVEYDAASDSRAAGMPHSFSARRPTKVITNASDDIVIGGSAPKPKSNKKPLIIGVAVVAVIAIIGLLVAPLLVDNTAKAQTLLKDNLSSVRNLERVFYDSYYNSTTVSDMFTAEKYAEINAAATGFVRLQQELSKISATSLKGMDQENYLTIQTRLNDRVQRYQNSVNLYNILYAAYSESNPDSLAELMTSEDYYTALMAERFYNYIVKKNDIQQDIDTNGCTSADVSPLCTEILADYQENESSLHDSTVIISTIFNPDGTSYVEEELISPAINKLVGGQN